MNSQINLRSRLKQIKDTIQIFTEQQQPIKLAKVTSCKHLCSNQNRANPIIIEKSSNKRSKANKTQIILDIPQSTVYSSPQNTRKIKSTVQKFQPIDIPQRITKKIQSMPLQTNKSQQIQIRIQETGKDCIKKLFKKINKLTQDLANSEKQKALLQLELKNRRVPDKNLDSDLARKLELQNHKLKLQIQNLVQKLQFQRTKPPIIIEKVIDKPIQLVKQIPIEKIVEVQVEVPKYIQGPQRIVQKIVEIPKYIQVQKPRSTETVKQIIKTVPQIIEKPIYIDKPIYIQKIVQKKVQVPIQIPVQVPIQVPIYINKSNQQTEIQLQNLLLKLSTFENQIQKISIDNQNLRRQNRQLFSNIEVLKRHNQEKNREVEGLIKSDYENRRGISIIRQISGIPSSQFGSSYQNHYSFTNQNFANSPPAY